VVGALENRATAKCCSVSITSDHSTITMLAAFKEQIQSCGVTEKRI